MSTRIFGPHASRVRHLNTLENVVEASRQSVETFFDQPPPALQSKADESRVVSASNAVHEGLDS